MLDKKKFNSLLKKAGLRKKEFSNIVNLSPITVNGWGGNDKSIPSWVDSWLNLYIENKACRDLQAIIKESGLLKD